MRIGALIMDPNTNSPIVVLKGIESESVLPIWVGAFEANAIALEIEKIVPQRPMTHDLLKNLVLACGLKPGKIVVTDLIDNTFFARIELEDDEGQPIVFDARPSDAIALALRLDCPIFVESRVLELSATSTKGDESSTDDEESGQSVEDWPEVIG
ncbi:MAG: bifunctional nuclease family protein [Acidobacteria bacterium]|nr:bifunctional nuclease family protein [Acidobacteriota bacterium]